jgi:hypothetical protein
MLARIPFDMPPTHHAVRVSKSPYGGGRAPLGPVGGGAQS